LTTSSIIKNQGHSESWCLIGQYSLSVIHMIGQSKMNEMLPDMTQFGMMLVYYKRETPTISWF